VVIKRMGQRGRMAKSGKPYRQAFAREGKRSAELIGMRRKSAS